ncbi:MAG: ParB/RepB/Spo0J family partition protein [Alphaproteobacteria bacterium]
MSDEPIANPDTSRRRSNLGRGLDALFGEEGSDYAGLDKLRRSRMLPIELLVPNPRQPRRSFGDDELSELADSIREQGVLQPILVRPIVGEPERHEIVAGERRWRAAQQARLHEVPVVIRELDDATALQIAIIENVQRQDLTALEEAEGYSRLVEEFGHTQEMLGRVVGKSRSHVANTLRLLELPAPVRDLLQDGRLTAGHARSLLTCADPVVAAYTVVQRGLNVRQTERLAKQGGATRPRRRRAAAAPADTVKDADTLALEQEISSLLGLRVSIGRGSGQDGTLTVHYQSLEQLDDLLQRLSQGARPPSI